MMTFKKSSLFLVASLATASIVLPACSSDQQGASHQALGGIGLSLEADGVVINEITYSVTHADGVDIGGTMDVSEKDAGIRIGGLPVGTDYKIKLTAKTTDGKDCAGEAMFAVEADKVTPVELTLTCGGVVVDEANGGVDVKGTVEVGGTGTPNACSGGYVVATPYECPVGKPVNLTSTAVAGATDVSYSWTQDGKEFSTDANAAFDCATPGSYDIKLTISGTDCSLEREVKVECTGDNTGTPIVCGDGKVEGTEECDDGNDVDNDECTNACTLPKCGDNIVQAGEECDGGADCKDDCTKEPVVTPNECGDGTKAGDEECDDGNDVDDDECTNACTLPKCGDNIVQAGEECDGGDDCEADCTKKVDEPKCGDGVVNQDSEECDDGNQVDDDECTNECKIYVPTPTGIWAPTAGDDCQSCVEENCQAQIDECTSDECNAVLECEVENACLDEFIGPLACLCKPGIGVTECQGVVDGAFEGPCATLIQESLGTVGNTGDSFSRFANTDYEAGKAHQVHICAGRFCVDACNEIVWNL